MFTRSLTERKTLRPGLASSHTLDAMMFCVKLQMMLIVCSHWYALDLNYLCFVCGSKCC